MLIARILKGDAALGRTPFQAGQQASARLISEAKISVNPATIPLGALPPYVGRGERASNPLAPRHFHQERPGAVCDCLTTVEIRVVYDVFTELQR